MIDPGESHVFAVGIGSYDLGVAWNLPHAAEHALAFAAWTRTCGVPRNQIHLFISSADRAKLTREIERADLDACSATFASITNFVLQELGTKSGELLYMFWAGHGSLSEEGLRMLFFEDLTQQSPTAFDLNDFFARLRTSSFQRFSTQIAFIDTCANRFEELGFDASLGKVTAGAGRWLHAGVRQAFFLAADSGEQAKEGAFGAAILSALKQATVKNGCWPPDQDKIVSAVRPNFEEAAQHPIQLVWTAADGDQHVQEMVSGNLPASRFVNAAAFSRKLPVRALRRLAEIALRYARLSESTATGATQRDELYGRLCAAARCPLANLARSSPRVEILHLVGAALQWNQEFQLAHQLGQLAPAAEFSVELDRLALMQEVRTLIETLPATTTKLRGEYLKTIGRQGAEPARDEVTTIDAMLDELYQISGVLEPQRPVWEFLLRLADRFPTHKEPIETFLKSRVTQVTLNTLRSELQREQLFVLSINLNPAYTEEPAIESIDARLVVAGTSNVVRTFAERQVTTWEAIEARVSEIVTESRELVIKMYVRDESALLVEFLMPSAYLTRTPDRLIVKLGGISRPLGRLHSVVVRLRERVIQRDYAINLAEWETIASRIDRDRASAVHWMDCTRAAPTIDTCCGLVVLQFLPSDDLLDIVNEGFPFLAWLRSEPDAGNWAEFVRQFDAWAGGRPLRNIARDVRTIRRKPTDLGANLTLFWDDPDQIGHWLRLADVETGGGS